MRYIDFVPGPMEYLYDVFVDAMIGIEYDNASLDEPYTSVIQKVCPIWLNTSRKTGAAPYLRVRRCSARRRAERM